MEVPTGLDFVVCFNIINCAKPIVVHYSKHFPFLAVPSASSGRRKSRSLTLIQVALKTLTLSQECVDGKLELGIPWDPLAMSATAMETCQRSLQRLSVWNDKEEKAETPDLRRALSYAGETFDKISLQGED